MKMSKEMLEKCVQNEVDTSIMWIIFGIFLAVLGLWFFKIVRKNKGLGESNDFGNLGRRALYCGIVAIFFVSLVIVLSQAHDIISCLTFPEKFFAPEITVIEQETDIEAAMKSEVQGEREGAAENENCADNP